MSAIALMALLTGCAPAEHAPPPAALVAPPPAALLGHAVSLNGDASMGEDLSFEWRLLAVPPSSRLTDGDLAGADTPWVEFTPDAAGQHGLTLTVCDAWRRCAVSVLDVVVAIEAQPELQRAHDAQVGAALGLNQAPEARGGVSLRRSGGAAAPWVFLDGQQSYDPDGDRLRYTWSFASRPQESSLGLGDIEGQGEELAAFQPDAPGTWTLRLTVSDFTASSSAVLESIVIDQATWEMEFPTD